MARGKTAKKIKSPRSASKAAPDKPDGATPMQPTIAVAPKPANVKVKRY